MKKEIPVPAIIGVIVAIIAVIGIIYFASGGGGDTVKAEIKKSPNYIEGIPDYVKQGRAPNAEEQKAMAGAGGTEAPKHRKAPALRSRFSFRSPEPQGNLNRQREVTIAARMNAAWSISWRLVPVGAESQREPNQPSASAKRPKTAERTRLAACVCPAGRRIWLAR